MPKNTARPWIVATSVNPLVSFPSTIHHMQHKTLPLLLLSLSLGMGTAQAASPVRRSMSDSLAAIGQRYADALQTVKTQTSTTPDEALENPYLFPLLTGANLYDFPLRSSIGTLNATPMLAGETGALTEGVTDVLLDIYTYQPSLVSHDLTTAALAASPIGQVKEVSEQQAAQAPPALEAPRSFASNTPLYQDVATPDIEVKKPNFWTYVGNFSFQFMQYHVSENWYKGGENHNSFLASVNLEANFDNKEKLTFTNRLEMKLGFQTSNTDKEHKYKTNADLLRMTNKLGLQATKHWYYTLMLQSWTQFYQGYKSNDPKVYSDFLSPLESIISLGMDYKLSGKNFKVNATLSPLAVAFKYVDRTPLVRNYGLEAGTHHLFKFGSTATITTKWTIMKDVQWQSRLYFFTNYKSTVAEWENTFNFKVNKYLSSKLFLFPRFDDGVRRRGNNSYFQFNEYLSVGLDLSF